MIAVHMRDSLLSETVDEGWDETLISLNNAAAQGKSFIVMDGADGTRSMFNMQNINFLKEIRDEDIA